MRERKFQNNYAWPGITAILYKFTPEIFFDSNYAALPEFTDGHLSEVGFEWKKNDDIEWTKVPLMENLENVYIQTYHFNFTGREYGANYKMHTFNINNEYCKNPTIILISGLTSNTQYYVRSYYILDNEKITYNEQTVQTIDGSSYSWTLNEPEYEGFDDMTVDYNSIEENLTNYWNEMTTIFGMFYRGEDEEYDATVKRNMGRAIASMGGAENHLTVGYDLFTYQPYAIVSTLVHEMGHDKMSIDDVIFYDFSGRYGEEFNKYKDKVVKFMEFVTSAPYACWQWKVRHNFPLISSAEYDFVENCIIAAACEITSEIKGRVPS